MSIDLAIWESEVNRDVRLCPTAREVAHMFAAKFRAGDNHAQMSFEKIADAAQIIALGNAREATRMLQRAGWLDSAHVPDTSKCGLVYWPTMSATAQHGTAA